ncbi:ABC-2 type transport system permease protein [Thermoanaerobacter thermohydrosulfuricus]|uniref:ABC-2 type transport system permease protein n=1 Tax=Thermoanaerobacter thermohydrosulfuricus TaxID=1516 RepID=A0A1G7IGC2_THETY|nr:MULTISPECIES: ABC transporter permease [Thermoanaerobacter]SDF11771.1 ABC-2 type transport system permease protein [Thermoanaerobacter thermohydrosulfuricus]
MNTFKAYLKKEIIESWRHYKYLILLIGIVLFAILDPIILKLLPEMFKNEINGDLASLIQIDMKSAVQNYIKDLNQISLLIVLLTLMGTLSEEVSSQKLVFPYSKGANLSAIVISKILHYSVTLSIFIITGFAISYYYATTLFHNNVIAFNKILISSILMSIYYIFIITLLIFLSSILKKGIIAALLVLILHIVSSILVNIDKIAKFIPYNLISLANSFSTENILTTIISAILYCIILSIFTMKIMNKIEII